MKKNRSPAAPRGRRTPAAATAEAAAATRAGAEPPAKPPRAKAPARRKPSAPAKRKPAAKPPREKAPAKRKPAARPPVRVARRPAASEPYAVRIARRGGLPEARPLEQSGAMAFPLGPHVGPPDFLDEIAAAEWSRIAELQGRFASRGLSWISEVDLGAFSAYCAGWSIWCRAARELMGAADFITTDDKGRPIPRPEVRLEREARAGLLTLAKELGLTSMVRSRIQAQMYGSGAAGDADGLLA